MKNTVIIASLICFLLAPPLLTAYSSADASEAPPVAQALVREGDFALKLAEALKLGSPAGEAEAMSALAAAGIAPRNGWIADYPVTPDILGELEAAVGDAADAGRLAASRDEALYALQDMKAEFGLAVAAAPQAGYEQKEPPESYPPYSDPAVVHNHYYNVGPPVVTYYPPPPDYYYLYSWVPYSFYWHSFLFPGFFILHDFNRVVFAHHRVVKVVSNHVFLPRFRKVVIVDHRSRVHGRVFEDGRRFRDRSRLDSPEARRGASSIVERSRSRDGFSGSSRALEDRRTPGSRTGNIRPESRQVERAFTNRGSGSGISGSGGRTESFSRPNTDRRPEGRRPEVLPDNRRQRSFSRPDASSSRSGRSFERPSTSGSGRPSFSSPSIRSGSGSGRGGVRQEMRGGGGGSSGRGGSARRGSSGGGCRGRC